MQLKIKVSTKKNKFSIRKSDKVLLVDVKSNPKSGKANLEIIREIKKIFKKETRIVLGHKSKNKIIEINCLREKDLNNFLEKQN